MTLNLTTLYFFDKPHFNLNDWFLLLRLGPTAAITRMITITTQRERTHSVERACAYSSWSNSTNRMRSLCVEIVIVFVIAAVWLGPYAGMSLHCSAVKLSVVLHGNVVFESSCF